MARNDELNEQSTFTQQLAKFVRTKMSEKDISIQNIADITKHAYSYAYNRTQGKAAFTLDDLTEIALLLGYKNIFDFMRAFERQIKYETTKASILGQSLIEEAIESQIYFSDVDLAASEDPNKRAEREYGDFGA